MTRLNVGLVLTMFFFCLNSAVADTSEGKRSRICRSFFSPNGDIISLLSIFEQSRTGNNRPLKYSEVPASAILDKQVNDHIARLTRTMAPWRDYAGAEDRRTSDSLTVEAKFDVQTIYQLKNISFKIHPYLPNILYVTLLTLQIDGRIRSNEGWASTAKLSLVKDLNLRTKLKLRILFNSRTGEEFQSSKKLIEGKETEFARYLQQAVLATTGHEIILPTITQNQRDNRFEHWDAVTYVSPNYGYAHFDAIHPSGKVYDSKTFVWEIELGDLNDSDANALILAVYNGLQSAYQNKLLFNHEAHKNGQLFEHMVGITPLNIP